MRVSKKRIVILICSLILIFSMTACGSESTESLSELTQKVSQTVNTIVQARAVEKMTGEYEYDVDHVSNDKYAYQTLNDDLKQVYDEIVYAVYHRVDKLKLSTSSVDMLEQAMSAFHCDYCDCFWLDRFSYIIYSDEKSKEDVAIVLTPEFSMDEEAQAQMQKKIDAEAEAILSEIPADADDYEKVLRVYKAIIERTDYVLDSEDNQNIISVFVNHESVCQGFSYATQYLLDRLDIPCATILGTAGGESHAWNLVMLDGAYYYLDTTWGDLQYSDMEDGSVLGQFTDYSYFCVTTKQLLRTHTPSDEIELPECTATKDNYFHREGLYVDAWDPDAIGAMISDAYEAGDYDVQIQFADIDLYEQTVEYFMEEGCLIDYVSLDMELSYIEDSDSLVLKLLF